MRMRFRKILFNLCFFLVIIMNIKYTSADVYKFSFQGIDGDKINLADYKNKPILIVNTASFCGYTYQYKKLQNLYNNYKNRNLVVIGIPSNDFGSQEFKKNEEVKNFCETNFDISFLLAGITNIKGEQGHPFFKWVKNEAGFLSFPKWNFYKFLIDKNGSLKAWFTSMTEPDSKKFIFDLESILYKKPLKVAF